MPLLYTRKAQALLGSRYDRLPRRSSGACADPDAATLSGEFAVGGPVNPKPASRSLSDEGFAAWAEKQNKTVLSDTHGALSSKCRLGRESRLCRELLADGVAEGVFVAKFAGHRFSRGLTGSSPMTAGECRSEDGCRHRPIRTLDARLRLPPPCRVSTAPWLPRPPAVCCPDIIAVEKREPFRCGVC